MIEMKKKSLKLFASLILAGILVVGIPFSAYAAMATVTEDSIRIRSEASTSSVEINKGEKGQSFKILETVSGADGFTWYKIQINSSSTGYVRGDLVKVVEESSDQTSNNNSQATANTATSLAPTEPTAITPMTATVAGNASVNIRSGAGTGYAKVASLDAGTSISLIGEANDASGNKWYQIKCEAKSVEGYLRSDLITISSEPQPAEENPEGEGAEGENPEGEAENPEEAEEPEPEPTPVPENNDYEIVYTTDDDGVFQYYLYDHINNTRQKVTDLLSAVNTLNENYQSVSKKLTTFKIIAGACGGLAVLLLIGLIFVLLRRNSGSDDYYYDDDDDEDDEDEEEEEVRRPQRREAPQRSSSRDTYGRGQDTSRNPQRRPGSAPSRNEDPRRENPQRRPRKVQNFLADDDEFEFEFLNMDDKD